MKKIISMLIAVIILSAALSTAVSAKGVCMFSDDFTTSFSPNNWMLRGGYDTCAFIWDHNNKYLYGQDDAIVLQSNFADGNKMWKNHYYSIDVRVQEGGLGASPNSNVIMQFQDLFQSGVTGPVYSYSIVLQTGEAYLVKEVSYTNEHGEEDFSWVAIDTAMLPSPVEIDPNAEWFNMGMRITEGRIQCYFNEELILESVYDPNDTKLGRRYNRNTPDSTVGAFEYPFVFINYDNILNLDNFQVWTGDYDFTTTPGDVNGDGKTNLADVSCLLKHIAKWKDIYTDIHQLDLNRDGNSNIADVSLLLKFLAGWDIKLK
ncbi:MAG: hypothetical protein E7578_09145 [Ruminococcaceae bacterium]|nr:hypothetical protein [Oscillospiraceae bacterium]